MKKVRTLALLALLVSADAMAQAIPTRSIEDFCTKIASSAGTAKSDLFGACVEAEKASLVDLKENWTDYSPQSRAQCLKSVGSEGLYADIEACIEAAEALRSAGEIRK